MARSAASHALLCLAAAACLLRGVAAADLMGSETQGELQLSCTTPQTCGTLQNREWGPLLICLRCQSVLEGPESVIDSFVRAAEVDRALLSGPPALHRRRCPTPGARPSGSL